MTTLVDLQNFIRYRLVPPVFLVFFTAVVQYLAITGQGKHFSLSVALKNSIGNEFSLWFVVLTFLWALFWLKIPSSVFYGPTTIFNYKPAYKNNGFFYYLISLSTFLLTNWFYPSLYYRVYDNMPQILGTLSNLALLLCLWLFLKGKYRKEHTGDVTEPTPLLYQFYRGVELHPRIFGVDVKQLTNCRMGMMGWQIYVCAYFLTSYERDGFNGASFVCFLLQTIYIAKFFWWEHGYFYTLDMMMDRAGYYLCWGCLVWIPCFFTYTSYYLVAHSPVIDNNVSILLFLLGVAAIFLTFWVDRQKIKFRNSTNYKCRIWGKPATYVLAEYKDSKGKARKTALLTSGFWGLARHMNYFFDFSSTFSWSACGIGLGHAPFLCLYFLGILFVHRVYRDDTKCRQKYGKYWESYCKQVKYRIIPLIW